MTATTPVLASWNSFRRFLAVPVFEGDEDKTRIASLTNAILLTVGTASVLGSVIIAPILRNYLVMVIFGTVMLPLSVIALFLLRRGNVRAAALIVSMTLWAFLIVMGFLFGGVANPSFSAMVLVIILAGLLMGGRAGFAFAGLSMVASTVAFVSEMTGYLTPAVDANPPVDYWMASFATYSIVALLLYIALSNLSSAIQRARRLTAESEVQRKQLENLVQEHTRELGRRANYLGATTAIAHESASLLGDPQLLLSRVVNVLSTQFGFYHSGIYLLDASGQWAELRAVSSQGGQQLLANAQHLRTGAEGIVGYVASRGVHYLASDVSQDNAYLAVPELPDTRSELALPLTSRGEIIGVLDIQSAEPDAFDAEDVRILQSLADQVAVVISHARLYAAQAALAEENRKLVERAQEAGEENRRLLERAQQTAEELNALTRRLTGEGWAEYLTGQQKELLLHDAPPDSARADKPLILEQAVARGDLVTRRESDHSAMAAPIIVRGEVIGSLAVEDADAQREWNSEDIDVLKDISEHVALALDNVRLFEQTQAALAATRQRAEREALLAAINDRIHANTDVKAILRLAVEELRRTTGRPRAVAWLPRSAGKDAQVNPVQHGKSQ